MLNTKIDFTKISLMDALDLAILIEQEAEERYKSFCDLLGSAYKGDAADFFNMMAVNEAKHGKELSSRRAKLFPNIPSRVNIDMIDDIEAPDYGAPRSFMSPRAALEVAMSSEIKAEKFFAAALEYIKDPQIRELFAELRDEEIEHQNLLKAQIEKVGTELGPDVDSEDVDTAAGD
ncbi:MAG: ferritin family protein [Deltaproteobacteria bacterium]|nr:MAG: ferritin family protein [Deltaproteobacteria bacterium]